LSKFNSTIFPEYRTWELNTPTFSQIAGGHFSEKEQLCVSGKWEIMNPFVGCDIKPS
jgi:hypothetical protein